MDRYTLVDIWLFSIIHDLVHFTLWPRLHITYVTYICDFSIKQLRNITHFLRTHKS